MRVRLSPIERNHSFDGLSPEAAAACRATVALYEAVGFVPPWTGYLATADEGVVGACAFTAPPRDGRVELAYHTFAAFERRGVASAMAAALVEIATAADPALTLVAHTRTEENASTAVLRRLGFVRDGTAVDPDEGVVWRWTRAAGTTARVVREPAR
jgi:[ribosomal protein S5]-alanine N-acetyltransferase